ncbi:hypothetical protein [Streptomyces sp. WAC 01529]|uniref:hypothetical protein n=1 Tax=Streptomyces sp. WAC 01529 TaxID=2203205 RepID=UPI0013E04161|nr:hypothetical protein [Streptomyces sp. WAC 01529]
MAGHDDVLHCSSVCPERTAQSLLDAAELQRLVLAAVERHVDRQALAQVVAEEARQRAALSAFVSGWPGARVPGGEGR